MNVRAFNRSLNRSRARAEERHLAAVRDTYARLIRQAGNSAAQTLRSQSVVAAANWQPPPEGVLFQITTVAPRAAAALAKVHRRIVAAVAGPPLERVGIAWDVSHPLSVDLLEQAAQRTGERLGEAVQPVLRQAVTEAYAEGLSVRDAAALIRERINDTVEWQAEMLARTDLNGLSNGGSVMAAKVAGIAAKTWLTASDGEVRPAHMAAAGQTVPIDQPFQVGGEALQWPGDPAGSDGNVANCRCTLLFGDSAVTAAADEGGLMSGKLGEAFALGFETTTDAMRSSTAAVTITVDEVSATDTPTETQWVSDVAFEGRATEDGRFILPDALEWREPPLTLMALTETGPGGHEGAFVAGRMDTFEKVSDFDIDGEPLPDGIISIRATGVFDMAGDNGAEVARLVGDLTVRGISVDLAVQEWVLRDPETGELFDPDDLDEEQLERFFFGDLQQAIKSATVMAATVCPTPAFADARIALTASGERVLRVWAPFVIGKAIEPLTAAAAGLAPVKPPRAWFEMPEAKVETPLTITPEGQVYGHIALWGSCHTGKPGQCFTPPPSPSGYRYFHLGEIECDDGERIACGQFTFHANHAPIELNPDRTYDHYANTGLVGADVRARDGRLGIWICGALRPNLTAEQARALMAAKPSGDWRSIRLGGPLELKGILAVNIEGYPVPRTEARLVASAEYPDGEMVALIASGIPDEVDAELERQMRVLEARAGGLDGLVALAEA